MLLASIGPDALERYNHFTFDEAAGEDSKSYVQVMEKFEDHFNGLKRTVFSRYLFWTYRRAEQQPFVDYLTAIQNLADASEFAEKENMIRDKIVFSIAPHEKAYQVGDKRIIAELYVTREKCVPILGLEVSVALGLVQPGDNLVTSQGSKMYIADTLSRAFLSTDAQPEHNIEMRIHSVSLLPCYAT